jgi:hypothetical protein
MFGNPQRSIAPFVLSVIPGEICVCGDRDLAPLLSSEIAHDERLFDVAQQ